MLFKFHKALHIAGEFFDIEQPGNKAKCHEVSEKVFDHPHFHKYVNLQWITDPETEVKVSHETLAERSLRLAEKLAASKKSVEVSLPKAEDAPVIDEAAKDDADEKVEEKKNYKKSKR